MKIITVVVTAGAAMLATGAARAALDDAAAADLMKKGGCAMCHTLDKKLIGPAYKDVALKRKSDGDAAAKLEKIVRAGSTGTYGSIPMPPNPSAKISDAELHSLVEWILTK